MSTFCLPDLGEGLAEAEIVSWHVALGDHVVADQPLVSVETDKAVLDVPSPQSARVVALHGAPGDVIAVGSPLVEFDEGTSAPDQGTVVGALPEAAAAAAATALAPRGAVPSSTRASPAVRALARRLGVALVGLTGSGPGASVSTEDVERAAQAGGAADAELLRGVRRAMARNMRDAHARVVPATLTDLADLHAWVDPEVPMVRLVQAMVAGCTSSPALNAWYLDDEERVVRHRQVHLGIATETESGLMVPVLRDAQALGAKGIADALARLKAQTHDRALGPDALRGATLSLSNFGMLGGEHAALVVLPPQVAILGAGRLAERPVAADGAAVVRSTLPLSLTFDHRVVSGGEAARFMAAVRADLERETVAEATQEHTST